MELAAKVDAADAVTLDGSRPPPVIVIVDGKQQRHIAAAETWADLGAWKLASGPKPTKSTTLMWKRLTEDFFLNNGSPRKTVDEYDDAGAVELDAIDDHRASQNTATDDPPPPEEEDRPDDGEEESGGTGTAMALEEGKMGKHPGQTPAEVALRRITGPRGALDGWFGGGKPDLTGTFAKRLAVVAGEVGTRIDPEARAVIVVAPANPARLLIEAVERTSGVIGVAHGGGIRVLRLSFARPKQQPVPILRADAWVEVRVSTTGLEVEGVPEAVIAVPWASGPLDGKALATALVKARASRALDPRVPVDVLVAPEVTTQRAIDVLVALELAGVRVIGLGNMAPADSPQMKLRGHRAPPRVSLDEVDVQGKRDKAEVQRQLKDQLPAFTRCYATALATSRDLEGTIQGTFFVVTDGTLQEVGVRGVDDTLAACMRAVVEKLVFSKLPAGNSRVDFFLKLRR